MPQLVPPQQEAPLDSGFSRFRASGAGWSGVTGVWVEVVMSPGYRARSGPGFGLPGKSARGRPRGRRAWFTGGMTTMAMFPLGSVLFPHMPIALRVFEERYLAMLAAVLQDEPGEFGVVLIERGSEVGGGDRRFDVGTVARIEELGTTDDVVAVIGEGTTRIAIERWVDEGAYPLAEVRELPVLEWRDEYRPLLTQAESIVRRTIARTAEFVEHPWSPDIVIDDDPVVAAWQLAGISPLGDIDQLELLRATSLPQLLTRLIDMTVGDTLTARWNDEQPGDGDWGTGA